MKSIASRARLLAGAALTFAILSAACHRRPPAGGNESPEPSPGEPASSPVAAPAKLAPLAAGPAELWKEFSGEKAMEHVAKQVALGPRPSGSAALEQARVLIVNLLKEYGWEVERQTFTETTPRGPITFTNLIGRYLRPGAKTASKDTQRAIVCSHYDTKRFSTVSFVGANDGGSSTGALIELARVLSLAPALAVQIELVFFDGEEAIVQFTTPEDPKPDGLAGSRHYARELRDSGRAKQFKFGILWDMIGDADFGITLPPDSPPALAREIFASATVLGIRNKFTYLDRPILDDHVPLNIFAKIPTIDLIDFEFLYWHTADDTLQRLSPAALQHTGAVTLHHLRSTLK